MVPIKTRDEIIRMRESCAIAANVLKKLCDLVSPGLSTYDLDQAGKELIESYGARSACYNYRIDRKRYPAYTCLSVNEEIVHGIGRRDRLLKLGDIVSVDVCIDYHGFIGDNARTISVGRVTPEIQTLLSTTEAALFRGISAAKPGAHVSDVSRAIQTFVEGAGYSVVRGFVGHGVGRSMHEEPQIPNYVDRRMTDHSFKPGMTVAIEPMVNLGSHHFDYASDGWTAVTRDRKASAHFEHTVLICPDGAEILTVPVSS